MDKKHLWIIWGIIAVLIPIIIVLCLNFFVWNKKEGENITQTVPNGGTVVTEQENGLNRFTSAYGYSLSYNPKYNVDFSGNPYDFYISNHNRSVNVAITVMLKDNSVTDITTKEQWDAKMSDMGESAEFKKTTINNMDAIVAHYYITDNSGKNPTDVLIAILTGDEYTYTYCYTAKADASAEEAQQIGSILYTITNNN